MKKQKVSNFTENGGGFRDKEIGYKMVLMYHLNNISTISATFPSTGADRGKYVFCKAVIVLDAFISPYKDEEYIKKKEELDGKGENKNDFDYATALLEIVMHQMARLGMLMQETVRDKV